MTAHAARRLACDARVQLLLTNSRGTLEALAASERTVPTSLRTAVLHRDVGRCRFPGCSSRIHEVHHVQFWSDGGPTTLKNLTGLCGFHHHLVHDGHWKLTGDPNHTLTFTGPDGRTWLSHPPHRQPPHRQPTPA